MQEIIIYVVTLKLIGAKLCFTPTARFGQLPTCNDLISALIQLEEKTSNDDHYKCIRQMRNMLRPDLQIKKHQMLGDLLVTMTTETLYVKDDLTEIKASHP